MRSVRCSIVTSNAMTMHNEPAAPGNPTSVMHSQSPWRSLPNKPSFMTLAHYMEPRPIPPMCYLLASQQMLPRLWSIHYYLDPQAVLHIEFSSGLLLTSVLFTASSLDFFDVCDCSLVLWHARTRAGWTCTSGDSRLICVQATKCVSIS